jgi:hypothetical protein
MIDLRIADNDFEPIPACVAAGSLGEPVRTLKSFTGSWFFTDHVDHGGVVVAAELLAGHRVAAALALSAGESGHGLKPARSAVDTSGGAL